MAPKKQQKGQKKEGKSGGSKSAPKVQITAQNEDKLRRLLLNNRASLPAVGGGSGSGGMLEAQRAKRLRNIYDKLACEGFTSLQIEPALSALSELEEATLEAALDWLCFNIPGHELPQKFSSGVSVGEHEEKSVNVISTARVDWTPFQVPYEDNRKPASVIAFKSNINIEEEPRKLLQAEGADWIRRYMSQQAEEECETGISDEEASNDSDWEMWANSSERIRRKQSRSVIDPATRAVSAAAEFQAARQAAMEAKEKGDKQKKEKASRLIRELKQEMISLGLSEDILNATVPSVRPTAVDKEEKLDSHFSMREKFSLDERDKEMATIFSQGVSSDHEAETRYKSAFDCSAPDGAAIIQESDLVDREGTILSPSKLDSASERITSGGGEEEQEAIEMLGLFNEDASSDEKVPQAILEIQKKEKAIAWTHGKASEKNQDRWRKNGKSVNEGDLTKQPKAVLQQQCQKCGWGAPKYEKISGRGNAYSYSLNILRPTTGRGKNRKVGGPITFQLSDQETVFESVDDAQNGVATLALFRLFPDLPLYQILAEPYRSLFLKWHTDEGTNKQEDDEDARRAIFVKTLMKADPSCSKSKNEKVEEPDHKQAIVEHGETILTHSSDSVDEERLQSRREDESYFLNQELKRKMKTEKYKVMLEARRALPMAESKTQFIELIKDNDVVVVSGETGCGKTTQVPQYILDDLIEAGQGGFCNIICTQPRRIAAISVAERVADERCEPPPGSHGSLVGYQVRLDNAWNPRTKLLFCTTGILLRKLVGDRNLEDVSHIIIDEVHERSVLGDFLLIILKDLLERRSATKFNKLKLILMSATVDATLFSHYFGDCPVITAKGRTHPVTTFFLEDVYDRLEYHLASDSPASLTDTVMPKVAKNITKNSHSRGRQNLIKSGWGDEKVLEEDVVNTNYDENLYHGYKQQTRKNLQILNEEVIDYELLEDLIRHIDENYAPGAILVFLPGMGEIQMLLDRLSVSHQFSGEASEWLLPLYSSIAASEQRKVFLSPPENRRKIVVATNIAETSITIDDVVYVIDCGKHKENRYDPQRKMSSMVEAWISKANAKQRCGRAGRVRPGICFCLYTHYRYEMLMHPFQVPEMLRVPLVELCLQIKSLSLGDAASFLQKALQPPREESVRSAIATLYEVGALEGNEELTSLGYHLAKLPVDVRIGKMMVYGTLFGCLAPVLTIAACLSHRSPFVSPKDEKYNAERAKLLLLSEKIDGGKGQNIASGQQSDHLLLVAVYNRWMKILKQRGGTAAREFCKSYFLSNSALYMIRDMRLQFGSLLADIGFIKLPKVDCKKNDEIYKLLDDLSQPFNIYAQHSAIVKSTLCAGLYPNVVAMEEGRIKLGHTSDSARPILAPSKRPRWFDGRHEVFIHPSSINHMTSEFRYPFMVFLEKVETTKIFLRDTTIISPYALLLFGGPINIQHQTGTVVVDGWLRMNAPAQTAVLFKELRHTLCSILQELIQKPKERVAVAEREVIHSIVQLLSDEEKPQL
ncbi:DExH-box ATP-dependent RNA helicase DExH7, chloroplastic isoform X2 [Cryptomeria japonica]|uniref:DExH-box ATP-dependent RNA helicase DExH7, chloroplastic isoform X2 n=1 Tax=Cryptomeria japonica TaxID=3369 RepID=UPI0027DA2ED3|nr:DExH-box ATP-dependent RNA helicase DExH7, chloroplastic isoform X2 [Cryptomeria japonica]